MRYRLTDAMESRLREHDNVAIVNSDGAENKNRVRGERDDASIFVCSSRSHHLCAQLSTESGKRCTSSHVICAITLPAWVVSSQTVRIPSTFQA